MVVYIVQWTEGSAGEYNNCFAASSKAKAKEEYDFVLQQSEIIGSELEIGSPATAISKHEITNQAELIKLINSLN